MGEGLGDLTPATVTFDQLGKTKEQEFLANLLAEEVGGDKTADAYVFVGSDMRFGKKVPKETLAPLANPGAPRFLSKPDTVPLARDAWQRCEDTEKGLSTRFVSPARWLMRWRRWSRVLAPADGQGRTKLRAVRGWFGPPLKLKL